MTIFDDGPRQETCVCGQQVQWYPSAARDAVIVLFHKNFLSYSHRFERPMPHDGKLEIECVRCAEPLRLRMEAPGSAERESRPTIAIPPEFLDFADPEE